MYKNTINMSYLEREGLREKADFASKFRCNTLIAVLENPKIVGNIGAVVRNIDTLGIKKLYVIDGFNVLPKDWNKMREDRHLNIISSSAIKRQYVRRFENIEECLEHLAQNNYTNVVTSPHFSKTVPNTWLSQGTFTQNKLAVWFGNETKGISDEAVAAADQCIQIETCGIIESMNLAVSTGIVLYTVAQQRRHYRGKKITQEKSKNAVV